LAAGVKTQEGCFSSFARGRWVGRLPTTIPDRFEGHPGYLHGGIIATLLDEAMSKAVRARGLQP